MGETRHILRKEFKKHKPSAVVDGFIEWMQDMKVEQEKNDALFKQEDGDRVNDFLHAIEFEKDNKKRAVIATEIHRSRKKRRVAKDRARALKPIREFVLDTSNKYFFKRLRKLQADLKKEEDYQAGEREYHPRVQDEVEVKEGNNTP